MDTAYQPMQSAAICPHTEGASLVALSEHGHEENGTFTLVILREEGRGVWPAVQFSQGVSRYVRCNEHLASMLEHVLMSALSSPARNEQLQCSMSID